MQLCGSMCTGNRENIQVVRYIPINIMQQHSEQMRTGLQCRITGPHQSPPIFCHLKIRYFKASINKMGLAKEAWESSYGKGVIPKFPFSGVALQGCKRGLCLLRVKSLLVFNPLEALANS